MEKLARDAEQREFGRLKQKVARVPEIHRTDDVASTMVLAV